MICDSGCRSLSLCVALASLFAKCEARKGLCSQRTKMPSKRRNLAVAFKDYTPSSKPEFFVIGGSNDESEFDKLYTVATSLNTWTIEGQRNSVLPHSDFSVHSIQRVGDHHYLLLPRNTSEWFWIFDDRSLTFDSFKTFPQSGLIDYCLYYDNTLDKAVVIGGIQQGMESIASDIWFTLDVSDLTVNLTWDQGFDVNTSASSVPFKRYGHSCCVIDSTPLVIGGYHKITDEEPSTQSWIFDDGQWFEVRTELSNHEQSRFHRRAFGACLTPESKFFSHYGRRSSAVLVGGETDRNHVNTAVSNIHLNTFSMIVSLDLKRPAEPSKNGGVFHTRDQHAKAFSAVLYDDYVWLFGGWSQSSGAVMIDSDSHHKNNDDKYTNLQYERIKLDCQIRFKGMRNPLNDWFGVPYYVLYIVGYLSSMMFREAKKVTSQWDDYDRPRTESRPHSFQLPMTSVSLPSFGKSVELRTMKRSYGISASEGANNEKDEQRVRVDLTEMYDETIVQILIEDGKFPKEIALIVWGFAGPLETDGLLFGRDYRNQCGLSCWFGMMKSCRIFTAKNCRWMGEYSSKWCLCREQCHLMRVWFRLILNMFCYGWLCYEYHIFLKQRQSEWQRACALWLIFFSHPWIKFGMELKSDKYDIFLNSGISLCNILFQLFVFFHILIFSVPVSLAGMIVFCPIPILFGLLYFGTILIEAELRGYLGLESIWFLLSVCLRVYFVSFAVFCRGRHWEWSFVYGFLGGDCDSWNIDLTYPPTYAFILAWIL